MNNTQNSVLITEIINCRNLISMLRALCKLADGFCKIMIKVTVFFFFGKINEANTNEYSNCSLSLSSMIFISRELKQ